MRLTTKLHFTTATLQRSKDVDVNDQEATNFEKMEKAQMSTWERQDGIKEQGM